MAHYVKTIGIRSSVEAQRIELSDRWNALLTKNMCFRRTQGAVAGRLAVGDRLAVYIIQNGSIEFPKGGFIGALTCTGTVCEDHRPFGPEWPWLVPVQCDINILERGRIVPFSEISAATGWSPRMQAAVRCHYQAKGGLLQIESDDFDKIVQMMQQ